ncbi:MAG: hypothetical protein PUE67_03415 [Oscillospiraceae bacterium]|nr:hypothetical protein [Oscillospiraceae bacterium]
MDIVMKNKVVFMKKLILNGMVIALSLIISGCGGIFDSMDRNNIIYKGNKYIIISQNWEMNSPEKFSTKIIENDKGSIKIRLYDDDINNDFIYIENDGLLFHNDKSGLPNNDINNIDYLLLRYHQKTFELNITDFDLVNEFILISSQKTNKDIYPKDNIASLMIYYKNYPASYFYGNIIVDNQDNYWIELSDSDEYIELNKNSELLSEIKSNLL